MMQSETCATGKGGEEWCWDMRKSGVRGRESERGELDNC